MRHHKYNPDYQFVVDPMEFDKYTDRNILQFCLGATMYMPGTKDFAQAIMTRKYPGLTSMVMCFEDACLLSDVPKAEENVHTLLEYLYEQIESGNLSREDIPLIFVRVRSVEQFRHFAEQLNGKQVRILAGVNFPKFDTSNGEAYYSYLRELNEKYGDILYGMPIIESSSVAMKETRMEELLGIKKILDKYRDIVLQVRVGATDFSSYFGARRSINYSVYDIMVVREILCDILNIFERYNEYVISGPVWEYFRANKTMKFEDLPKYDFSNDLIKRETIFNEEVDGLLREVMLDKANGFVGRTIIHPTHLKFVNGLQAVIREEYEDALQILGSDVNEGGVIKSKGSGKMNEIKPHTNWAKKIFWRAKVYGVIENQAEYLKLINVD